MQNNGNQKRLGHIRDLLQLSPLRPVIKIPVQQRILEKYGKDNTLCPCCKIGRLVIVYTKRFGTKPITNQSLNRFTECKINERTREKLNFDSSKNMFYKFITDNVAFGI